MKKYKFITIDYSIGVVSSIREKQDIILLLLNTIKYVSSSTLKELTSVTDGDIKLVIYVDKMSRVFYCKEEKIHTFQFPFSIIEEDGKLKVYHNEYELDSKVSSILIAIFQSGRRFNESLEYVFDVFMETMKDFEIADNSFEKFCWDLVVCLLTFESGYLRYDYDDERDDVKKHPLNHLDIYYSNKNTFKIGLDVKMNSDDLLNLLDINENCRYLK